MGYYSNYGAYIEEKYSPFINTLLTSKARVLGSERNGKCRYASSTDMARSGDIQTCIDLNLSIPLNENGEKAYWIGAHMTEKSGSSTTLYKVYSVSGISPISRTIVSGTDYTGRGSSYVGSEHTLGVLAIFDLKPDCELAGGDGSYDNPYVITAK